MFRKIVSATDRVDGVAPQVLTAMEMARQGRGKLLLLHVLEPEAAEASALEKGAVQRLEKTYRDLVRPEDDMTIRIARGLPWEEILNCAMEQDADLIVVGAHGNGAGAGDLAHAGLGSTAQGVIMGERCPVMVVGGKVPRALPGFRNIMVCMDFSPSCECALRVAKELARENRGKIHLFNMLPLPPYPKYSRERYQKECGKTRERLETLAGEVPPGVCLEYSVIGGVYPHLAILEFAEKRGVEMILMGSHTKERERGPMAAHTSDRGCRWYVGSAVERVGRGASCPVLVVTDPQVVESVCGHAPGKGSQFRGEHA